MAFATLTGAAFALFVVVGGSEGAPLPTDADGSSHPGSDDDDDVLLPKEIERQARSGQVRRPIRGTSFPDGVLALTWDDGPDSVTIDLAKYLRKENVTATFFVVGGWSAELSMEPGTGANVFETGYERMGTVLPELTRLGHRVGGHTAHHSLLTDLPLLDVDKEIAPSLDAARAASKGSEVTFFRAPGGAWSDDVGRIAADLDFVGPIHWDIDAKDWDSSLYCRSSPKEECEPSPVQGETRVRADVIARRYLAQIESSRHGIVLFHDRVGHVGSRYALDLAKALIPALVKRGFVFTSPLLSFGPWAHRLASPDRKPAHGLALAVDALGACLSREGRLECHRAVPASQAAPLSFDKDISPAIDLRFDPDKTVIAMADLDGDHQADACALDTTPPSGALRCVFSKTSAVVTLEGARWDALALGDVDGDGLADACGHALEGSTIGCAKSNGRSFEPPRPWLGGETAIANVTERDLRLADLDGDHRADICGPRGCALSTGTAFDKDHAWPPPTRSDADGGVAPLFVNGGSDTPGSASLLRLGDVNGDGRADLCAIAGAERALFCALSDGHGWKRATLWASLPQGSVDERAPSLAFELADINGDGRADVCTLTSEGVSCAMAP